MEKDYERNEEIEIDLWELLYALRARIWLILLAFVLGSGIAIGYSKLILTPKYTSTSMVYILSKETTLTSLADLQLGSQLTKDYKVLVTSRPVLQEVIDSLELDMGYGELKGALVLNNPADTRIMSISIEDPDPARAKAIVDHVAEISAKHIGDIMEITPPKVIEDGIVSNVKSSPSTGRNAMMGGMVGALLVAGLVVLRVILNDTIRTEEDVEKYLKISVLAAIPDRKEQQGPHAAKKQKRRKKGGDRI